MIRYITKIACLLLFCFTCTLEGKAQDMDFLIPDAAIIQHAGSIGYFSAGVGYEIFKNKRGKLDFHYGYVPASKGGELHTLAVKFAYKPFEFELNKWIKLFPFNPGLFFSYTFHGDLLFKFNSSQYPAGYYYWSTALRPHLSVSNEIEFDLDKFEKKIGIEKLGVFTEFNTNDYYLINYVQNTSTISITDIFMLGVGMRLIF